MASPHNGGQSSMIDDDENGTGNGATVPLTFAALSQHHRSLSDRLHHVTDVDTPRATSAYGSDAHNNGLSLHYRTVSTPAAPTSGSLHSSSNHSSNRLMRRSSRKAHSGSTMPTSHRETDGIESMGDASAGPEDEMVKRMWAAFLDKHDDVQILRIQALDLRKQCLLTRRTMLNQEFDAGSDLVTARQKLERDEERLNGLDEELIQAEYLMKVAAPKLMRKMRVSLPGMLARHQLDFPGEASTGRDTSASSLKDLPLDDDAIDLESKQARVDELEGQVLNLRRKRDLLQEFSQVDAEDNEEQYSETSRQIHDVESQLDSAITQLDAVRADFRHATDRSASPGIEYGFDMVDIFGGEEFEPPFSFMETMEEIPSMVTTFDGSEISTIMPQSKEPEVNPAPFRLGPPLPLRSPAASSGNSSDPLSQGVTPAVSTENVQKARK